MFMFKNELLLAGKVIEAYEKNDMLYVTMSVIHNHNVNGVNVRVNSVFRVMMTDQLKIKSCPVRKGDKVEVNAYLKQDFRLTSGGNEKKYLNIYANDIKIIEHGDQFYIFSAD